MRWKPSVAALHLGPGMQEQTGSWGTRPSGTPASFSGSCDSSCSGLYFSVPQDCFCKRLCFSCLFSKHWAAVFSLSHIKTSWCVYYLICWFWHQISMCWENASFLLCILGAEWALGHWSAPYRSKDKADVKGATLQQCGEHPSQGKSCCWTKLALCSCSPHPALLLHVCFWDAILRADLDFSLHPYIQTWLLGPSCPCACIVKDNGNYQQPCKAADPNDCETAGWECREQQCSWLR